MREARPVPTDSQTRAQRVTDAVADPLVRRWLTPLLHHGTAAGEQTGAPTSAAIEVTDARLSAK